MQVDFVGIETYLKDLIGQKLEWMTGRNLNFVIEERKISLAALEELKQFYFQVGQEKFIQFVKETIVNDCHNPMAMDLLDISDNKDLRNEYSEALLDFNRQFIATHIDKFPIEAILRFLTTSIGNNSIAKEFIDSMKFNPDAPKEIRQALVQSKFIDVEGTSTANNELWFQKPCSTEDDIYYKLLLAKDLVLDEPKVASDFYYDIITLMENMDIEKIEFTYKENYVQIKPTFEFLFLRAFLCQLLAGDYKNVQNNLNKYKDKLSNILIHLEELASISTSGNYDAFLEKVRKEDILIVHSLDISILIKIKNNIAQK